MRRYLPELVALPMLPFLIAQGKYTRRVTPRLPEAAGPAHGVAGECRSGEPLALLSVGESPVAGVGVTSHDEAITGQLAAALAAQLCRPVSWQAFGKNGVTVREAMVDVLPHIPSAPVDIALVAFGVNDTTAFRPVSAWRRDLCMVLDMLEQRCRPKLLLLAGVPPLGHFPALPQPLRWVMGLKGQTLDHVARAIAKERVHTHYVPVVLDTNDVTMLASDGYHPSARGCTAWAGLLAEVGAREIERFTLA